MGQTASKPEGGGCPVGHDKEEINPLNAVSYLEKANIDAI